MSDDDKYILWCNFILKQKHWPFCKLGKGNTGADNSFAKIAFYKNQYWSVMWALVKQSLDIKVEIKLQTS